jgi:ribosomal protein L7/L12
MKWKVTVQGDNPTEESVRILTGHTGLPMDSILLSFSQEDDVECTGLSEAEAQNIADSLRRDSGIHCRVLPDIAEEIQPAPRYRVLLVNYRPGYRTRLRRRLQELTRLPQDQVVLWLSRMPFALSRGIDSETAKRIKKSISEAGGIARIETESQIQDRLTTKRRSNAVFKTSASSAALPEIDESGTGSLFEKASETAEDAIEVIPPVITSLPDGYSIGPPPIDEVETSGGRVFLHPPARYAVGSPSRSVNEGIHTMPPPVLPDVSDRNPPEPILFSPPDVIGEDKPPVVNGIGGPVFNPTGPFPGIVIPYPPCSRISAALLLPPVLRGTDINRTASNSVDGAVSASEGYSAAPDGHDGQEELDDDSLKLFLCTPSPNDEDRVAEALRDVIGVSLRESWDLLRKTPILLETCTDQNKVIRTAHELESLGVTVSIARGDLSAGRTPAAAGDGLQAWLSANG